MPAAVKPRKGDATRSQILEAAVAHACAAGFESLTIGTLAERTGMSKSGLFAHFGSKLELQLAALDEAARQFSEQVFLPALKAPRGLRRLRALFENWLAWPHRGGGCPIDAASREYDDRPGPMREAVLERLRQLDRELVKAVGMAVETGELAPGTDPAQVAFDLGGILLVFHRAVLVLGRAEALRRARTSFERLLAEHAAAPRATARIRR